MDRYGILSRGAATTSWTDLYTCPVAAEQTYDSSNISVRPTIATRQTSAVVSTIVICRLAASGGAAQWISLAVTDAAGGAVNNENYIVYQQDVDGGDTRVMGLSMTLSAGQTIRMIAEANSSIAVTVNGVEIF